MNWYAYKVLADHYAAERRHEADRHRQRRAHARAASSAGATPSHHGLRSAWRSMVSALRPRRSPDATTWRPSTTS